MKTKNELSMKFITIMIFTVAAIWVVSFMSVMRERPAPEIERPHVEIAEPLALGTSCMEGDPGDVCLTGTHIHSSVMVDGAGVIRFGYIDIAADGGPGALTFDVDGGTDTVVIQNNAEGGPGDVCLTGDLTGDLTVDLVVTGTEYLRLETANRGAWCRLPAVLDLPECGR